MRGQASARTQTALGHVDRNTHQLTETLVNTPALTPGQSVTLKADCGYAPESFRARADASSVVDENDETNNARTRENDAVAPQCRYN